jgi:sodium bicarbonate transporter 10
LIVFCSIFGLPWFVAATVLSINHVRSLTRESETAAPGEKPQFLGIREQRVTHIVIFTLVGLSVLMVPVLKKIPMPVLYGVFLFMGVASLNGLQFFDRILLLFMPKKYQPDLPYLRRVPILRVHIFTGVQFACLVGLWVIKDIKQTSILFPVMLVVMMGVRKLLDYVFEKHELKILDDILPEFKRHEKLDDEEALELGDGVMQQPNLQNLNRRASVSVTSGGIAVPLANGNIMMIPVAEEQGKYNEDSKVETGINITEQINSSGVWTSLVGNNTSNKKQKNSDSSKKKNHGSKKRTGMSVLKEDDDEDDNTGGISIKFEKPKTGGTEPGSCEEHASLVKHSDTNGTNV